MEKQLGIVFAGGKGPPPDILRKLLRGKDANALLVAADSGLILAETAGLRPDWIIGDMDSLGDESRLRYYPEERVVRHAPDKEQTDTELAIELLWEKGCDEVWIVGGGGGRMAHLFAIRDLFERERFPCRWITTAEDLYCLEAAGDNAAAMSSLSMTLEQGDLVSVFPLGDGPWEAESQGLQWPLDEVHWKRGQFGLSNVPVSEEITVCAKKGRFLVVLEVFENFSF